MNSGYKYKLQQQQEQQSAELTEGERERQKEESASESQVQSQEGIHIRAAVPDAIPARNVIEHVVDTNPAAAAAGAAAGCDLCSSSAHSGAGVDHHGNGA